MSVAKFTSIFAGFIYLSVFVTVFSFSGRLNNFFNYNLGIENKNLFAAVLASAFFFAIGNFTFSYFIQIKEKYHQVLENALFFSIQLLIIPALLFIGYVVVFVSLTK